jgi:hypothetical protein
LPRLGGRGAPTAFAAAFLVALALAGVTQAEVTVTHDTVIRFESRLFPRSLPRQGSAPVGLRIEGHLRTRSKREPATLTKIELAIDRAGHIVRAGLPVCDQALLEPASTSQAMAVCGKAKIGYGRIRAQGSFPGTPHFYFHGRAEIFNGRLENGRPAILLHVFNRTPPASFVFPLRITRRKGRYGTVLVAHVRIGQWSRVTDFRLVLKRSYRFRGRRVSYLTAGCPTPQGFSIGVSPFVVATLGFADGSDKRMPLVGVCRVRR